MRYGIKRDPRNRIYFTPPEGLYVPQARHDNTGHWIGLATGGSCAAVETLIDGLVAKRDQRAAEAAVYAGVKGEIPGDYKPRHGALCGGTVTIGDWSDEIHPVALGFLQSKPDWTEIGSLMEMQHTGRYGDTLYRTVLTDGRPVYRETHIQYDDWRETYYFPEDVFRAVCIVEIRARKITREKAAEWLASYRGCVDTELYELAATLEPAPQLISAE